MVAAEPTLPLSDTVLAEPDIVVFPLAALKDSNEGFVRVARGSILLAIETAVPDLRYDRALKADVDARHGVRECWGIDANERATGVHTNPAAQGRASGVECGPNDSLTTAALPRLTIRLAQLR